MFSAIFIKHRVYFCKDGSFWAFDIGGGCLFEISQYRGKPPLTPVHNVFCAFDTETIDAFFRTAIEAGGIDNGTPGLRPQYAKGYYACFLYDPSGH